MVKDRGKRTGENMVLDLYRDVHYTYHIVESPATKETTMDKPFIPTPEEMDVITSKWRKHQGHNTEEVTVPTSDKVYQLLIITKGNLAWCHDCEEHFTS